MSIIQTPHTGLRRRHDTAVFEKHVLSNGVVVWRQKSPILLDEEGTIIAFFPHVGSSLDPVDKRGLAHFIEHMPFKGTKAYPSPTQLNELVYDRGGTRNATTSKLWTRFNVEMPGEHYREAVSLLREFLLEPLYRPEDVEVERGVIMSEYNRRYAQGANLLFRDVKNALFGDHPFSKLPSGTPEGIAAITSADIRSFHDAFYRVGTLQFVVGGTFAQREDWFEILDKTFGTLAAEPVAVPPLPLFPFDKNGDVSLYSARYGRDILSLNWLVPAVGREEKVALSLLCASFAGAIDAPLIFELRERLGLTYESGLMGFQPTPYGIHISANLPVPATRFEEVDERFGVLLSELTSERVVKTLSRWQLDRLSAFRHPTTACFDVVDEVVVRGAPSSFEEDQALEDAIDLDTVWRWRERLLKAPPFIVRATAQDK